MTETTGIITKQEKYQKNSHCSFCGYAFPTDLAWPRRCPHCGNTSYLNPLPVSVVLVPVDNGLLLIRRAIPPRIGSLALPGGFINLGESWQQAGAREVQEETGLSIPPEDLTLYDVHSAPDGTVLIFGLAQRQRLEYLPASQANGEVSEVSEVVISPAPVGLAFPLHTLVATRFWNEQRR